MRLILGIVVATPLRGRSWRPIWACPFKAPDYAPPFSWTGTYVGANVGGVWGAFAFNPATTNDLTGAVGVPGTTRTSTTTA